MSARRGVLDAHGQGHSVLVVDDDRRVRELLEIALTAHGYGVLTAADGDEAIRRAFGQRPDLVVLDVRLPKKSGLEVCDALRGDAEDPSIPIILVSAAVETDARLQAFARGADDYLAKPFSPKELIARIKRHLARSVEAREARRRAQELEREIVRARSEASRALAASRRGEELRELSVDAARDFHRVTDRDALAHRILGAVQARVGVGAAALIAGPPRDGLLLPCAVRGADWDRLEPVAVAAEGELARFLAGLDRPALRAELERIPELAGELAPFAARGFSLFVPLRSATALGALIVADERRDGRRLERDDLDLLAGIVEPAALAFENTLRQRAQIDAMIDLLAESADGGSAPREALAEAARLISRAARASRLPGGRGELCAQAVRLGAWAARPEGRQAFERLRGVDPTGRVASLERLIAGALAAPGAEEADPHEARVLLLVRIGRHFADRRACGAGSEEALASAIERYRERVDAVTRGALAAAAR